jgi:hypothetical protein
MMVRLETREGPVTLNLQPGALSLHLYGRDVLAYDRAGRLWSATLGELTYRRGLDNRIQAIWMTAEGLRRRWLSREEVRALEEELARRLRELLRALSTPSLRWITPPPDPEDWFRILEALRRAAAMDFEALEADARRFAEVYAPIGPPRSSRPTCMRSATSSARACGCGGRSSWAAPTPSPSRCPA